jgi:hypothetical protein
MRQEGRKDNKLSSLEIGPVAGPECDAGAGGSTVRDSDATGALDECGDANGGSPHFSGLVKCPHKPPDPVLVCRVDSILCRVERDGEAARFQDTKGLAGAEVVQDRKLRVGTLIERASTSDVVARGNKKLPRGRVADVLHGERNRGRRLADGYVSETSHGGRDREPRRSGPGEFHGAEVLDPLVGPDKTIARVVDLLLGEIVDPEESLKGIARLAQLAVSGNHVGLLGHGHNAIPLRCGGLRPVYSTYRPDISEGRIAPQCMFIAPQPAMAIKKAINIMNAAVIRNPPTEWVAGSTTKVAPNGIAPRARGRRRGEPCSIAAAAAPRGCARHRGFRLPGSLTPRLWVPRSATVVTTPRFEHRTMFDPQRRPPCSRGRRELQVIADVLGVHRTYVHRIIQRRARITT